MAQPRVLTGIKPTGQLHIGNYIGAIRPALALAEKSDDMFIFIADYHSLNAMRNPEEIRDYSYEILAAYIALGLDPSKATLYRQSDVPEIFELSTMLMNMAPKGLMNRAHAYKAAVDKNRALGKEGAELDEGINMGLYTYPILMAADILIAQADIVPVGKDQVQHIEMARDMAGTFNHLFGETFTIPDFEIQGEVGLIVGLDGQKMSKSYNNTIPIFETSKKRRKLIMKIVTDSKLPEEPKNPDESTICDIYKFFGTAEENAALRADFEKGGLGYGDAKQRLFEAVDRELAGPTEIYNELIADKKKLDDVLAAGAEKMAPIARETINKMRDAVGFKAR